MTPIFSYVKKHKTFFLSITFLVVFSVTVSYATPPSSPYVAGQTLDPSCAPGSSNCTVQIPVSPWSITGNDIYYNTGNVGIGTTTPSAPLDVNGEVKSKIITVSGVAGSPTVTPASNVQASIQYNPSYDYQANGLQFSYRVYAYKTIGSGRVYSMYATLGSNVADDNSANYYAINVSWSPSPDADGYRVIRYIYANGFHYYFSTAGYDTTNTSFVDGDGTASFSSNTSVTPTVAYSSTSSINGPLTLGGDVTVSGASTFNDIVLGLGTYGSGAAVPDLGAGTRMMWVPNKAAFRAGTVSGTQWNDLNVGSNSAAFGSNTIAFGDNSFAVGNGASALGNNSFAVGSGTAAIGDSSFAVGSGAAAFGDSSFAGSGGSASGTNAFAWGGSANASASGTVSFGGAASGDRSVAFGNLTTASGDNSFVIGNSSVASGNLSFAVGNTSIASGNTSFAVGDHASASGAFSTALGRFAMANAYESTAIGTGNVGGGDPLNWVDTDPLFEIGNGFGSVSNALTVLKNGNTGIALGINTLPSYTLQVGSGAVIGTVAHFQNSTGSCDINPTSASLVCSSDMNLKNNIVLLADNSNWNFNSNIAPTNQTVLAKILALNPVIYNWKTESANTVKHPGFIAQEVQQVFPDLVATDAKTNLLSLNYTGLIPYTIEAIKEMDLNITSIANLDRSNTWRDSIVSWLGSATNGIDTIFSKKLKTDELCVGTVCVTQDQFMQMVQNNSGSTTVIGTGSDPVPPVDIPPDVGTQTPDVAPVEPVIDPASSQTPDVAPIPPAE